MFLASAYSSSFGTGIFGELMQRWQDTGIMSFILPWLLIFALVFGILSRINVFGENKTVSAIIAVAVAFLSLQFGMVPQFFAEVFPRLGVGLSIILVALIFGGLFLDPDKPGIGYGLLAIGAIILIVVLVTTAGSLGWSTGDWFNQHWGDVVAIVVVIVIIAVVAGSVDSKPDSSYTPYMARTGK